MTKKIFQRGRGKKIGVNEHEFFLPKQKPKTEPLDCDSEFLAQQLKVAKEYSHQIKKDPKLQTHTREVNLFVFKEPAQLTLVI